MKHIIQGFLGLVVIISRIYLGCYVIWYLFCATFNTVDFPLEKLQWFIYLFIWDIWVDMSTKKLGEANEETEE